MPGECLTWIASGRQGFWPLPSDRFLVQQFVPVNAARTFEDCKQWPTRWASVGFTAWCFTPAPKSFRLPRIFTAYRYHTFGRRTDDTRSGDGQVGSSGREARGVPAAASRVSFLKGPSGIALCVRGHGGAPGSAQELRELSEIHIVVRANINPARGPQTEAARAAIRSESPQSGHP